MSSYPGDRLRRAFAITKWGVAQWWLSLAFAIWTLLLVWLTVLWVKKEW